MRDLCDLRSTRSMPRDYMQRAQTLPHLATYEGKESRRVNLTRLVVCESDEHISATSSLPEKVRYFSPWTLKQVNRHRSLTSTIPIASQSMPLLSKLDPWTANNPSKVELKDVLVTSRDSMQPDRSSLCSEEDREITTLSRLSPLDELTNRLQQLAARTPTTAGLKDDERRDRQALYSRSGDKSAWSAQPYRGRRLPITPRISKGNILSLPSRSMLIGSERYPASTCSPLPDFDAMAAQECQATTPPLSLLDTSKRSTRTRGSSVRYATATPIRPVYNDELPASVQPQTPADIVVSARRGPLLSHSVRRMVTPELSPTKRQKDHATHRLPTTPLHGSAVMRRTSHSRPRTAYRAQAPMAVRSVRRTRRVSHDQENIFNPAVMGFDAELQMYRSRVSSRDHGGTLDRTPPPRGRFDQYL